MATAVERLLRLRLSVDPFNLDQRALADLQLEAANERLEAQTERIPLLHRASAERRTPRITHREDLVSLLFPESIYKSYRRQWIDDGEWDALTAWLRTVTAFELRTTDVRRVASADDLSDLLERAGCRVSWSRGATSQSSMIASADEDLDASTSSTVRAFTWATGIQPTGGRRLYDVGPYVRHARHEHTRAEMVRLFGTPGESGDDRLPPVDMDARVDVTEPYRAVDGGDADWRARWASLQDAFDDVATRIVAGGDREMVFGGSFTALFAVADRIRANGHSKRDFHHDNAIVTTGGLRDATLRDDYREFICDALNVPEGKVYNHYSMHEINSSLPECRAGRYHVPPWVVVLPLDEPGETLLGARGEIEGRAGFFDVSVSSRWGGIVTGDLVGIDYGRCGCGRHGPTIDQDVVRYANLLSGDRLARTEEFGRLVSP